MKKITKFFISDETLVKIKKIKFKFFLFLNLKKALASFLKAK